VGELEVRPLRASDLDALLLFAGQHLQVSSRFLRQQLLSRWAHPEAPAGAAAGAFDRQGRLHGFVWLDDYRQEGLNLEGLFVRSLLVAPRARRMGVASRLLTCLLEAAREQGVARVYADIDDDNHASLRTFAGAGFLPSSPELTRRVNAAWGAAGGTKPLVVVERALG
jgi:mycothiol synthase